jgi:hypothetical protein
VTWIAHELAGLGFEDAHRLRRAMRTRRPERVEPWRRRFLAGATTAEAEAVFDFLLRNDVLTRGRGFAVTQAAQWVWRAHARQFGKVR